MFERPKMRGGKPVVKPIVNDDGEYVFETVGYKVAISEIDGAMFTAPVRKPKTEPVMETAWRYKFPNGRLVIIAAGRVLLRDIPNPFQTDGFPFAMWKDYDTGGFWGQGEPIALKDMSVASNRIISQVYDILEKTGNPSFKLKKGAGVNAQSIKNKPGAIIPMDELDALQPLEKPQMPQQFFELFETLRKAMGEVSGVNDSIMGAMPSANTSFAAVDQLTEAGAAPIRLKVRNMEEGITRMGKLRVQLIQQFDKGRRPLRRPDNDLPIDRYDEDGEVVEPVTDNQQWIEYNNADLQGAVEFGVVPISSLSTSPAGAWNRWMTMYKEHLVDRRWWHDKNRIEGYRTELPRMEKQEAQDKAQEAAAKQKGKPGPAASSTSANARRRKAAQPPASAVPNRAANAAVR
jgi:hypothetical protein